MSEEPGFIVKFYDKKYEKLSIVELVKAPVAAISGVSEKDSDNLKAAFGIETVKDFATNRYVKIAQGISCFSDCSGQILDKEFESKEFVDLANKPVSAISGVSENDAVLLKKAFGIDSISELANNKFISIAQATVALADLVQYLKSIGVA